MNRSNKYPRQAKQNHVPSLFIQSKWLKYKFIKSCYWIKSIFNKTVSKLTFLMYSIYLSFSIYFFFLNVHVQCWMLWHVLYHICWDNCFSTLDILFSPAIISWFKTLKSMLHLLLVGRNKLFFKAYTNTKPIKYIAVH